MPADLQNPVFLRVFWDRLISVTNEQAAALIRTGFTPILRDAEDLSAGVFDTRARMIAQSVTGTPGHINSMATGMKHILAAYPLETLEAGDVLITNDPWYTSGHLNDLTVATPIFRNGTIVGFFANTCHAIDIGGLPLSADANDVYEEGLYLPIMKLYRAGIPNHDLFAILRSNVREPLLVLGDLHAQVACNEVGGQRLLALLEEFELDTLDDVAELILQRSEETMRNAIAALPDGQYSADTWADGYDEPVYIKAVITVAGNELIVDYSGSSSESRKGINVPLNYSLAYTTFAIKAAVSPDVPNNDGSFRPVRVVAPPGCILNAQSPAPVAARAVLGHFLPSVLFRALTEELGSRAMAGGADPIWLITVQGTRERRESFTFTFFSMGGMGARAGKDGLSTTGFPSGVAGTPVEVIENLTPTLILRRELRQDSGGPGNWRGGLGQTLELKMQANQAFGIAATCDRTRFAPEGINGGCPGARAFNTLDSGEQINLKSTQHISANRNVVMNLPGGGGFGHPFRRPAEHVLADVIAGYISIEAAENDYGVVIARNVPDNELVLMPEDFEIDEAATRRLRNQGKARCLQYTETP